LAEFFKRDRDNHVLNISVDSIADLLLSDLFVPKWGAKFTK